MEDLQKIKHELELIEKDLKMMESRFNKKVKMKNRRYSGAYLKSVTKSAYLYGKFSVLKEFMKDAEEKGGVDYIG